MAKRAVSVTLEIDNLRWLQGQVAATRARGVSETLDRLVTSARLAGRVHDQSVRSVIDTIEINLEDPELNRADEYIRGVTQASLARPFIARQAAPGAARFTRSRSAGKARRRG